MAKRGQGKSRHLQKTRALSTGPRTGSLFEDQVLDEPSDLDEQASSPEKKPDDSTEVSTPNDECRQLPLPPQIKIEAKEDRTYIVIDDSPEDSWDVSFFASAGLLRVPLENAIALVLAQMDRGRSRKTKYKELQYGFMEFASVEGNYLTSPDEISKEYIQRFVVWLSNVGNARNGDPLTPGNKSKKLTLLRDVIEKVGRVFPQIDVKDIFPVNAWAKDKKPDRNKTKALESDLFRKLIIFVETELTQILETLRPHLPADIKTEGEEDYRGPGSETYQVAKRMVQHLGFVPQMNEVISFVLEEKAHRRISPNVRPKEVLICCGPTASQTHLFLLYFLIYTAFNEQPIRDLEFKDIEMFELAGFFHTTFRSDKRRAGSAVRRKFTEDVNASLSIASAINMLGTWTSLIRPLASVDTRDKVLLYVKRTRDSKRSVGSFASARYDREADALLNNHANRVSKMLGGRFIGSRAIRAASAELLHDAFEGDLVLLSLSLAHSNAITTDRHYRSPASRDADAWRLAAAMQLRERWFASDGVVDSRASRALNEVSGATPGWGCMDNLDSPFEDQVKGRPCMAYPMCPACPLSVPLLSDKSYVLARTVQLFGKLEELKEQIGPARLSSRYGKLLMYLGLHFERLAADPDCEAAAAALVLNPLPDLE